MVLRFAEQLDVPLRERNAMLSATGYARLYGERPLSDPALATVRDALQRLLNAHAAAGRRGNGRCAARAGRHAGLKDAFSP